MSFVRCFFSLSFFTLVCICTLLLWKAAGIKPVEELKGQIEVMDQYYGFE